MAASARAMVGSGLVAVAALGGFAGCDSTQSKNERAKLRATRELARREPQRVGRPNPDVRVTGTTLVRGPRSSAVVVELRSRASRPLTDVPIAVGVRGRDGRRVLLNARKNQDWFQTHVPAIPAGGRATWVFEGGGRAQPGGRVFARVGIPTKPAISRADSLPRIEATVSLASTSTARKSVKTSLAITDRPRRAATHAIAATSRTAGGPHRAVARVVVVNDSDVPQYGLQVYALAREGGRYVAAGKTAIEHLGTGRRTTATVPLIGRARGRPLRAYAIPTIFE